MVLGPTPPPPPPHTHTRAHTEQNSTDAGISFREGNQEKDGVTETLGGDWRRAGFPQCVRWKFRPLLFSTLKDGCREIAISQDGDDQALSRPVLSLSVHACK